MPSSAARPHLAALAGPLVVPSTHRPRPRGRGRLVLALTATLLLAGTGTAVAYWAASGSGTGAAAAGTAAPLTTITSSATPSTLLYPNGPAAAVTLTVANPNSYAVTITAVAANGAVAASGGLGTCTTTGVTLGTPTSGLPVTVPANGSATVELGGAATMTGDAENGCQGATFTLPVSLTGASA